MSDPDEPQRLAYKPSEVARLLGVSDTVVYELMASGRLEYRQLGPRLRLVSHAAIERFLATPDP
jgi:excisionase family DNA binding protein